MHGPMNVKNIKYNK